MEGCLPSEGVVREQGRSGHACQDPAPEITLHHCGSSPVDTQVSPVLVRQAYTKAEHQEVRIVSAMLEAGGHIMAPKLLA